MNTNAMQRATKTVERIYAELLTQVVDGNILTDRVNAPGRPPLSEQQLTKIEKGTHVDVRMVRLMAISGKGDADHQEYTNVTLLDHLLSVARGGMMLAALDWLMLNPEMEQGLLERRLAVIAVIALLHDIDKDLALPRNEEINPDAVGERMARYGIPIFLDRYQTALSAAQMLYLIEKVEATQAHRHATAELPPREFEALTGYVRLADKLDGIWLSSDPEKGGLKGVIQRLEKDEGCLHGDLLRHWRIIDLFDPHHPFLLDELQRWLSLRSRMLTGVPPLIETHQDGRLYLLIPREGAEAIIEQAIKSMIGALPFELEMTVSNRGIPLLQGTQPNHEALNAFLRKTPIASLTKLFNVKAGLKKEITEPLDQLLYPLGLSASWPKKIEGLLSPFSEPMSLTEEGMESIYEAAHLALLLNLRLDCKGKLPVPPSHEREIQLLQAINHARPEWIEGIEDNLSRRNLTALWCLAAGKDNYKLHDAIWAKDGLLREWLEGSEEQPGINQFILGKGDEVSLAIRDHFSQLLSGKRAAPHDENRQGRCLFTNEPTLFTDTIDSASGLYGVKVSAFSGRDSRPEGIDKPKAHTNVGPVSLAEHKLRKQAHATQGGKDDGIPILISSPTTSGLFGGLVSTDDKSLRAMSLYDLSRQEKRKGTTLNGTEMFRGRYRMARLERLADKTENQVDQLRLFLQATRRIGRPLHLFRGLPTAQQAFFYFDALPLLLRNLIGGTSLRLEEIPEALERLELAHTLLAATGLGYDALRLYADPQSRLGGITRAWCELTDRNSKAINVIRKLDTQFRQLTQENTPMNPTDGAFVRLGRMAAQVQRYVPGGASANLQMMIFKLGLNALQQSRAAGQSDRASLINAIAGELEQNLLRRNQAATKGGKLIERCIEIAELMVDEIWLGALQGHTPSQTQQRVLGNIYRMAFYQAQRERFKDEEEKTAPAES